MIAASRPPACRTDAPIGSPERVQVYAERYARGEYLYHPDDTKNIVPPVGKLPKHGVSTDAEDD